jgi:hypothetical protein
MQHFVALECSRCTILFQNTVHFASIVSVGAFRSFVGVGLIVLLPKKFRNENFLESWRCRRQVGD